MKLVDRLIPIVDRIRDRVNDRLVGVRRFRLIRVVRTWSGGEVGDGTTTLAEMEILPRPAIEIGSNRDQMNGFGRVRTGKMTATEISLTYTEADLFPSLTAGQELYYRLVDLNTHEQANTYWHLDKIPDPDRCETVNGNLQWIADFTKATITE